MFNQLFSNVTVTKKGLILVLVPALVGIFFFCRLGSSLADAEARIAGLQREREVVLGCYKLMSIIADGVTGILHQRKTARDPDVVLRQVESFRQVFVSGEMYSDVSALDPELKEVMAQSQSIRSAMIRYLDSVSKAYADPQISTRDKPKYMRTRVLLAIILENDEMFDKVVKINNRIKSAELDELSNIRTELLIEVSSLLIVSALASVVLAAMFNLDIRSRLKEIAQNILLVSGGRTLPAAQSGRDEIAQLDRVVHETSDALAEIRRKELAILDNAADVICSLDERLRIVAVSATVSKIWRYSPDELLGTPLANLLTRETHASTAVSFERVANGTGSSAENVVRCGDGTFKNFSWSVSWSPEKKQFFCVAHDVTERRAVEKLKQHFLSIVSHDLRAPVTATGLSISLLTSGKRGELSQDALKVLGRTETSIARLTELVNELLELDKLEAGKLTLDVSVVSAYDFCLAAKEALEGMANSASVRIEGPKGDAAIKGDELRLVQVVSNLLSNAIKFSPKDGTVTLRVLPRGKQVEIRIEDEGPGISAEDQALIFDKFQQTRTEARSTMKSTGLGLAIVKAIVEAHMGEIGVESELGKGSTFWIRIDRAVGEEGEDEL